MSITLPSQEFFDRNVTGSVRRRLGDKDGDVISAKDFGATGDGTTDDATTINAALTYAGTLLNPNTQYTDQVKGGVVVYLPPGRYITTTATLIVPPGVSLVGAGKTSTVIQSSVDGPIIRNDTGTGYNWFGARISDLAIYGDRTKTSQYGIDVLRPLNCTFSNLYIQACGKDGVRIRQGVSSLLQEVDVNVCVGKGFFIDGGVNSWADQSANSLPSNANVLHACHANSNDAAGLYLGQYVNGTIVEGGAYENNYFSSATNVGFNIELRNSSGFTPNELNDVWVEGKAQAHIYQDLGSATPVNRITRLHHFGGGSSGNVDRAIINNAGTLLVDNPFGHGTSYKSIASSISPFRLTKAGSNAIIRVINAQGSGLSDQFFVEDENGNHTGLENFLFQNNWGKTLGNRQSMTMDSGNVAVLDIFQTGDANPWMQIQSNAKKLAFGAGGASAIDTSIFRAAANVLKSSGGLLTPLTVLTYSATIATDASLGNSFSITATNGTAFTISNPTNLSTGQRVLYAIRNGSGGALGAITWGATFKINATAIAPANATSRSVEFIYDGTNLVELWRGAVDVPN